MTLWPWPLTYLSVLCTMLLMSDHISIQLLLSYDYRFLSIEYLITFPLSEAVTAHAPWPVTGGKNCPYFWNLWHHLYSSLCHFQGATTKIKPCYRQKIAFSHHKGYKVYYACALSRDLFAVLVVCCRPCRLWRLFFKCDVFKIYNYLLFYYNFHAYYLWESACLTGFFLSLV